MPINRDEKNKKQYQPPRVIRVIALKRIYGRYCDLKSTQAIVLQTDNDKWLSIPSLKLSGNVII